MDTPLRQGELSPAAAKRLAVALARDLDAAGTAVVLDLEPVLGIHVASQLHRQRLAHVVLVLPRWPYAEAILPVGRLIASLVHQSRHLEAAEDLPNVVFVLDAERNQTAPHRPSSDPRTDNRYRLSAADLPDLAVLRRAGIHRVLKLLHA
jgi:hypothetical protein